MPSAHELTASVVLRIGQTLLSMGKALSALILGVPATLHACNDRQGTWQLSPLLWVAIGQTLWLRPAQDLFLKRTIAIPFDPILMGLS